MTLILLTSVFATAVLSGIFGMAGGMALMGILIALMPVPEAMVVHGISQLAGNAFRSIVLRKSIHWPTLRIYIPAALVTYALFELTDLTLPSTLVMLVLGALPFLPCVFRSFRFPPATTRGGAALSGLLVSFVQFASGVAGPLLDLFFLEAPLSKEGVVATKAATQSVIHALKIVLFAEALRQGSGALAHPAHLISGILVASLVGTLAGTRLLERLDERRFRSYTRRIVMGLGAVYLFKGLSAAL